MSSVVLFVVGTPVNAAAAKLDPCTNLVTDAAIVSTHLAVPSAAEEVTNPTDVRRHVVSAMLAHAGVDTGLGTLHAAVTGDASGVASRQPVFIDTTAASVRKLLASDDKIRDLASGVKPTAQPVVQVLYSSASFLRVAAQLCALPVQLLRLCFLVFGVVYALARRRRSRMLC
jgi:hypothetical protein